MHQQLPGRFLVATLTIGVGLLGCVGDAGVSGGDGSGGSGNGTGGGGAAGGGDGSGGLGNVSSPLLPARVRRLTNSEYDASVRALLGTTQTLSATFPPDSRQGKFALGGGFTVNDRQFVDPILGRQLSEAAIALVAEARQNGTLAAKAPCANPTTGGEACARTFVQTFGAKVYRRPLTADEVNAYLAPAPAAGTTGYPGPYHAGADGATYDDGIDMIVRAMLQSAGFLYVTEIGDGTAGPGADVTLTPHETASVLSYLVTSGPPDDALVGMATSGLLASSDGRQAAAAQLIKTQGGQNRLVQFVREWFSTDQISAIAKDTNVYPGFAMLRDSMASENDAFVREALFNSTNTVASPGTIAELLGADWTIADGPLAIMYGTTSGGSAQKTMLGSVGRRGILNQAAFLSVFAHASESAPVFRGVAVMRQIACMQLGSPTQLNINVTPPAPDPAKSTRDRYAIHALDPLCAGCHDNIDSIGFAFEAYDGMGQARPVVGGRLMEDIVMVTNGQTVRNSVATDASTTIGDKPTETKTDFVGAYADSNALAMALASSAQVRTCLARQLFRASAGRSDGSLQGSEDAFVASWQTLPAEKQGNVIETLLAYARMPTFVQRRTR